MILSVVVVLVLWMFGGCAKSRYLTFKVDSQPSRCSEVYLEDTFGDRRVVTDERELRSSSAKEGFIYAGRAPLNLYFYYKEGESYWTKKDAKRHIDLPGIVAIWPSGAKVREAPRTIHLDDVVEPLMLNRPLEKDASGWNLDMQCEANQIASERNKIEQEGVDEQGRSRVQSGILGVGLLCVLTGKCR